MKEEVPPAQSRKVRNRYHQQAEITEKELERR